MNNIMHAMNCCSWVVGADWTLHPWCHKSSNVGGVTAGQVRHISSNVGGVAAGLVGHNSSVYSRNLKCYYRPTASLQLNNKRNTKYNITVT